MGNYTGELAALGTAILFSFGSTLFTLAGRELGSSAVVNRTRLLLAVILLALMHWVTLGHPFPLDADISHWFWLAISGIIGLALGDAFLFQAFVMIGPRLSMLMMALAPVIATILAWIFLGETLDVRELAGIALTVGGTLWVVSDRNNQNNGHTTTRRAYLIGVLCGLGGAIGQAGGMVTAKLGLTDNFPALSGNVIRMVTAAAIIWIFTALRGEVRDGWMKVREHPRALQKMTIATLTGPVVGVWLSLIAVQNTPVGIASTLMSLTPIFLIPIAYFVFKDKVTLRAILGTIIAFAGTALLFL
ncbi:MAG: DMT family transporter [Anaerolineae bacterium]|nr:DMT family transporter [Anaerolineae bacterium]